MTDSTPYTPPTIWKWNKSNGGRFANINRPIAGPTHDKPLPTGRHPFQLYSLGTPNGVKVTVMFEELLALGHSGAEYDAWLIRIDTGDQFGRSHDPTSRENKANGSASTARAKSMMRCSICVSAWVCDRDIWMRFGCTSG